tara:strand:- start:84 stop:707 length:624 start_codon:yes stop_codon:yes gene_type:complete
MAKLTTDERKVFDPSLFIQKKKFKDSLELNKYKSDLLINANKDTKVAGSPTSSPYSEDWRFDDGYDDIESYRGQPVFGVEEGGQTFFEFPFVKIRGNNQKVASTPQDHPRWPNTPFYNTPNELKGVSPWIIDDFIKQKGKAIFKLNTGIPLAKNKDVDFQDTWKHMDPERKQKFLEEFRKWQLENNIDIPEDKEESDTRSSLKIGTA